MKANTNKPNKGPEVLEQLKSVCDGFDPILDELKALSDAFFEKQTIPTFEEAKEVQAKIIHAFQNRAEEVIREKVSVDSLVIYVAETIGFDCAKAFVERLACMKVAETLKRREDED